MLTDAHARMVMILDVLANAWQFDLDRHTDLVEDFLSTESRQFEDLWGLQRA